MNEEVKNGRYVEFDPTSVDPKNREMVCWYKEGKLHREDGPAVTYSNGAKIWYLDGEFHREGGPAIESKSCDEWYINGVLQKRVIRKSWCNENEITTYYDGDIVRSENSETGKITFEENNRPVLQTSRIKELREKYSYPPLPESKNTGAFDLNKALGKK